jgi:RNA polymerase sigma factor (sigma-70 family)
MSANESSHRGEFFKNNYGSLVAYTRQLIADSSERDGEDIVQDVMVSLFDKADVMEPIRNLTGYVYTAIRNRIVDAMRTRKKHISLEADIGDEPGISLKEMIRDTGKDALGVLEEKDRKQSLYRAIDSLSDDEKAIVIATEFDGRTFRELSEEWETPMGTLLSRKSRALEHIGEFLKNKGFNNG